MPRLLKKSQFFVLLAIYTWLGIIPTDTLYIAGYNDKLLHFTGYIVLMNSCLLAYGTQPRRSAMFSLLLLYSFSIELIQYFLPWREFSLLDLLANALGLFTGQILGLTAVRLMHRFNSLANTPGDNDSTPAA